ncbi:hypothetical protein [Methylomonas sp. CM2]|uniref:hypothetical protein n=1 Tax=Methylomonas sp. CM2 TaxID=3417647 RepID=UPI003CE6A558
MREIIFIILFLSAPQVVVSDPVKSNQKLNTSRNSDDKKQPILAGGQSSQSTERQMIEALDKRILQTEEAQKKSEDTYKDLKSYKDEELKTWRKQSDAGSLTTTMIGFLSFFVMITQLAVAVYLWLKTRLLSKIDNLIQALECSKKLPILIAEIQLAIVTDQIINMSNEASASSQQINTYIYALDVVKNLQMLAGEDQTKAENSCNFLQQIWFSLDNQSKSLIRSYITEILSSPMNNETNKVLLKNLNRNLN